MKKEIKIKENIKFYRQAKKTQYRSNGSPWKIKISKRLEHRLKSTTHTHTHTHNPGIQEISKYILKEPIMHLRKSNQNG